MFHRHAVSLLIAWALGLLGAGSTWGAQLQSYWDFDEAASGTTVALDQVSTNNGAFQGTATRTAGLLGLGAAQFNTTNGDAVNVGNGSANHNFSFTGGISLSALIRPTASLGTITFQEIFRKEDGGNRILFSFQNGGSILSFGLNDGDGYTELDMPLDGLAGRPTLADFTDGNVHHVAATYDATSGVKRIFVDGSVRFSSIDSPGQPMVSGGTAAAFIGASNGTSEPFSGDIDEVGVFEDALTEAEGNAIFNLAMQPGLQYDLGEADQLFTAFNQSTPTVTVAGIEWRLVSDGSLGGSPGDVASTMIDGLPAFTVNLGGGNGLQTVPVPEPSSLLLLGLAGCPVIRRLRARR